MKVLPCTTTATLPNGTLAVGETTSPKTVPAEPTVYDAWLVAIPPTVMLFAAMVPDVAPWTSMRRDVGAEPMKLNVVWSLFEL